MLSVAVIGGGIAGLSVANRLSQSGRYQTTVFDTGRLRMGGRCSSRLPGDNPKDAKGSKSQIIGSVVVDHAAQILSVPGHDQFEAFREQVVDWEEQGVLCKFCSGQVCDLVAGESKEDKFQLKPLTGEIFYGNGGMNSIPAAIISSTNDSVTLEEDVWVSPSNGVKFLGDKGRPKWKVKKNGLSLGTFDRIVIAHNGKCADRLMSKTPAKKLHSLLRTNFAASVSRSGGKRMTLNSIYSYTFAINREGSVLNQHLGPDVICCFIKNEPNLRFLTCQTRKEHTGQPVQDKTVEVWTILSSPKFAKAHKAPQENIPRETADNVIDLLLQALETSLSLIPGSLTRDAILDSKLQLWGAAVPMNVWTSNSTVASEHGHGFLFDSDFGVGACGDWLLDPSIGGAWTSGLNLADFMIQQDEMRKSHNVGLPPNGGFQASEAALAAGIGNVR
jgi:predicted NAD/FAD-dependent oxidoreductase